MEGLTLTDGYPLIYGRLVKRCSDIPGDYEEPPFRRCEQMASRNQ